MVKGSSDVEDVIIVALLLLVGVDTAAPAPAPAPVAVLFARTASGSESGVEGGSSASTDGTASGLIDTAGAAGTGMVVVILGVLIR